MEYFKEKKLQAPKRCILEDFMLLLKRTNDFSGLPDLEKYFSHIENTYTYKENATLLKKDIFMLFCIYRLSHNLRDKELKNFECDCTKDVTELYKVTYPWLNNFICESTKETAEKYQLRHPDTNMIFKGDVITSPFRPVKEYLKLKSGIKRTSSKDEDMEAYWLRNIDNIDIPQHVTDFIYLGYSFANFLPVPKYFNGGRSNYGKWDSWDLTLTQIHQWYIDNSKLNHSTDDSALEKLFKYAPKNKNPISYCREWLKSFHSWENFIEENYMQAFILPNGHPKKFFQNHTLEYGLPKTLKEYDEFFENAISCIKERENYMNRNQ